MNWREDTFFSEKFGVDFKRQFIQYRDLFVKPQELWREEQLDLFYDVMYDFQYWVWFMVRDRISNLYLNEVTSIARECNYDLLISERWECAIELDRKEEILEAIHKERGEEHKRQIPFIPTDTYVDYYILYGKADETNPESQYYWPLKIYDVQMLAIELELGMINNYQCRAIIKDIFDRNSHNVFESERRLNIKLIDNEDDLSMIIEGVILSEVDAVTKYRSGEQKVIGHLIGQCMKVLKGQGDPKKLRVLLVEKLSVTGEQTSA